MISWMVYQLISKNPQKTKTVFQRAGLRKMFLFLLPTSVLNISAKILEGLDHECYLYRLLLPLLWDFVGLLPVYAGALNPIKSWLAPSSSGDPLTSADGCHCVMSASPPYHSSPCTPVFHSQP